LTKKKLLLLKLTVAKLIEMANLKWLIEMTEWLIFISIYLLWIHASHPVAHPIGGLFLSTDSSLPGFK